MESLDVSRAVDAAISVAVTLELPADDAVVLHNSNKLALRLLPCDVFARVAHVGREVAALEVELAQRLADIGSPAAALDPRVEPRVYARDGYAVTLWSYYEPTSHEVSPVDYADALERLHAGMRMLDVPTPHFTDRVARAERLVRSHDLTPGLTDADREVLSNALRCPRSMIRDRGAAEQLLHGEPHPGNVLSTANGPLLIDLETCCRGPIEFDLARPRDRQRTLAARRSRAAPRVSASCSRNGRRVALGPERSASERSASWSRAPERAARKSSVADA